MSQAFGIMHNLSYPEGSLVLFGKTGHSLAFIGTVHVEAAFRIILVAPSDMSNAMMSFQCRDMFYIAAFLPIGCCSSCAVFVSFSTAYTAM